MLDPYYITGFTDGEGTFTYCRVPRQNTITLVYAIKLHVRDYELLRKIQEFFRVGKLYNVKPSPLAHFKNPTSGHAAYYRVTKMPDLLKIVAHFDKYPLQGDKAKSYELWKKMVFYKKRMYRHEMPQLLALAAELSTLNGPGGHGKPLLKPENAHLLTKKTVSD